MASQIRHKEYRFPVHVAWDGERRTTTLVEGKPPVRIAAPPQFRGTDPDLWSPEDALVAATASCLGVTLAGLAKRTEVPLRDISIEASGVVGHRDDGKFGFLRIEQTVEIETDPEHEAAARALVAKAEDDCLVAASLDLPVLTNAIVRTPALAH